MSEFEPSLWQFFIEITEINKPDSLKFPFPGSWGVGLRRGGNRNNIENALIPVSKYGLSKPIISGEIVFFQKFGLCQEIKL